jgi:AraC-like DNA-binding protein
LSNVVAFTENINLLEIFQRLCLAAARRLFRKGTESTVSGSIKDSAERLKFC